MVFKNTLKSTNLSVYFCPSVQLEFIILLGKGCKKELTYFYRIFYSVIYTPVYVQILFLKNIISHVTFHQIKSNHYFTSVCTMFGLCFLRFNTVPKTSMPFLALIAWSRMSMAINVPVLPTPAL